MEEVCDKINTMNVDLSENFVIAACNDSMVRLFCYRNKSLQLLNELSGHSGVVTQARFINHGELIASSDFNGKLIIWKTEDCGYVKKAEIQVTSGPIYDFSVHLDENHQVIKCGCDNGKLKTVKLAHNMSYDIQEIDVHRYGVIAVDSSKDFTITGSTDCGVAIIQGDQKEILEMHQGAVNGVAINPRASKEYKVFATCSEDGNVVLVTIKNDNLKKQVIEIGEPCYNLSWNRPGFILTVGYGNGKVKSFVTGDYFELTETALEKI